MAVSGGVAGLGTLLPSFELPVVGGGRFRSWDLKGRQHLVVWLTRGGASRGALLEARLHENRLAAENARLVIVSTSADAEGVLLDADGRVHDKIGADEPTLLVADKNGGIYYRAEGQGNPDLPAAIGWLEYINILEPECGTCVPAWPID